MQNDLWLDVLAGSIGAMLWAAGTLYFRRLWLETKHPMAAICLFGLCALGLAIFVSRAAYWAAERSAPIVSALQ